MVRPVAFPMRVLHVLLPFLFVRCRFGNRHWRWERLCFCGRNFNHDASGQPWAGGILDLRTNIEFHPRNEAEVLRAAQQYVLTGMPLKSNLPRRIRRRLHRQAWTAVKKAR